MTGRRRRSLSPEEAALWRSFASTATPLAERCRPSSAPAPPTPKTAVPLAEPRGRLAMKLPQRRPIAEPRVGIDLVPDPHVALHSAMPLMDRRRLGKLRRGRLDPDARLDLHGLTSDRAHAVLTGFVLRAHDAGHRLVLVITGKGRPPGEDSLTPHRHGVLRHSLPHWLAAPPLASCILQILPAHRSHGGGGAYYVYLRRRR